MSNEYNEDMARGFYEIPSEETLDSMSFLELAEKLSNCDENSPRYIVFERALKKHIHQDQASINRKNILVGAAVAGSCTIIGAIVGAWLRGASL